MALTINRTGKLVVQDAEAYQVLRDRVGAIEGILRGLADVKAGRTKPAREVFDWLRRKHGIHRGSRRGRSRVPDDRDRASRSPSRACP